MSRVVLEGLAAASLASTRVVDGFLQSLRVRTQSRMRSKLRTLTDRVANSKAVSSLSQQSGTRAALAVCRREGLVRKSAQIEHFAASTETQT